MTVDPLGQAQAEQLFSLKEWMADISRKLDRLENKLDTKADLAHVHSIDARLGIVEKQQVETIAEARLLNPQHARMLEDVGVLKQKAAAVQSVDVYKRWVWGTALVSLVSVVATIMQAVAK